MWNVTGLTVHGICNCRLVLQGSSWASVRVLEILLAMMLIATAESQSARGASHQPAFMGSHLSISETCLPWVDKLFYAFYVPLWLGWFVMVVLLTFFCMVNMVVVLWWVAAILRNGCGIQGQNHVAWLQGSKMSVGFHCKNFILGV